MSNLTLLNVVVVPAEGEMFESRYAIVTVTVVVGPAWQVREVEGRPNMDDIVGRDLLDEPWDLRERAELDERDGLAIPERKADVELPRDTVMWHRVSKIGSLLPFRDKTSMHQA